MEAGRLFNSKAGSDHASSSWMSTRVLCCLCTGTSVDRAENGRSHALLTTDVKATDPVGRKERDMSSFIAKPHEIERKWYVVDAEGKNLGRMASQIAAILRGKNKPIYTPHVDCGDYVIVINAEKVEVTGNKRQEKIYKHHSGYPGGLKETTFEKLMEKHPTEVVRHAVKGMMPNGRLGRQMYKKLKVYAGPEHKHEAQKPEPLDI